MKNIARFSISSLLVLTLFSAIGVVTYQHFIQTFMIVAVPRPNSGTYSTATAQSLLGDCLLKTEGLPVDHELIENWKNPSFGFHVHIDKNANILVNGPLGTKTTGLRSLEAARDTTLSFLDGNPASVLMTSDTDGWDSPEKRQVIETLFEPAIQIFVVHQSDGK